LGQQVLGPGCVRAQAPGQQDPQKVAHAK
jgi:hypothetical protein